jgi:hypothetical protein
MTIFMANKIPHTSTLNQAKTANLDQPSLSVGSLQKKKVMDHSAKRRTLLSHVVSFATLKGYQTQKS